MRSDWWVRSCADLIGADARHTGWTRLPSDYSEPTACAAVERMVWLELRRHGALAVEIADMSGTTWWPWLRGRDELWECLPLRLRDWAPRVAWGEPQIVVRLPDPYPVHEESLVSHVDEGDWAAIVQVAITPCGPQDGALAVWSGSHAWRMISDEPITVSMAAGDVMVMDPHLKHAGTLNLGPRPRIAVYWRLRAGLPQVR